MVARVATSRILSVAALALVLVWSAAVRAQSALHQAVVAAAPALATFDPDSDATTRVIAELGRSLRGAPDSREAREASFIRAIASADLLLIARHRRDAAMHMRLAEAYGSSVDELAAAIRADLGRLEFGVYEETAVDAAAALDLSGPLQLPSTGVGHTRRQAAFFSRVSELLIASDSPSEVLGDLADDPCVGAGEECPSPYRSFGSRGRRAIAAFTRVFAVASALQRTAMLGDPFSAAVAREVLVDLVVLRSMAFAPGDWAPTVRPVEMAEGRPVNVDALVVVGHDVRAGWVPEIRWDARGRPVASAAGVPLLADAEEDGFPITRELPSFIRPIDGLSDHLARRLSGARRIGIAVEPGVEAHVLSRVLRSIEEAGLPLTAFVGVSADATPRGVLLQTRHAGTSANANQVGVFVRIGGFSVRRPRHRLLSLPRIYQSDAWRYDIAGLARATPRRGLRSVVLRYMGTAPADVVSCAQRSSSRLTTAR